MTRKQAEHKIEILCDQIRQIADEYSPGFENITISIGGDGYLNVNNNYWSPGVKMIRFSVFHDDHGEVFRIDR